MLLKLKRSRYGKVNRLTFHGVARDTIDTYLDVLWLLWTMLSADKRHCSMMVINTPSHVGHVTLQDSLYTRRPTAPSVWAFIPHKWYCIVLPFSFLRETLPLCCVVKDHRDNFPVHGEVLFGERMVFILVLSGLKPVASRFAQPSSPVRCRGPPGSDRVLSSSCSKTPVSEASQVLEAVARSTLYVAPSGVFGPFDLWRLFSNASKGLRRHPL